MRRLLFRLDAEEKRSALTVLGFIAVAIVIVIMVALWLWLRV